MKLLGKEIWRDIIGYEGKYQVSNCGRVKSLNYHSTGKEKLLKEDINQRGYHRVTLFKDNKGKSFLVSRLVAYTFINFVPQANKVYEVNHKDEDKDNNSLDNLEIITKKANLLYGTGRDRQAKSKSKKVICIETGIIYASHKEAREQTGINNIYNVCNGKAKTSGGYHWQYI